MDEVIDLFKRKVASSIYEPSDASYRSQWFCMKKNGTLCIVHDLQRLNVITIHNAAIPPFVNQFVESMAAQSCYTLLNLFFGYDHRMLNVSSCNLTRFQTPATNAVVVFHGDVTFTLEPEIPHITKPLIDDTAIRGPMLQYETPNGGYKMIPENPGI